MTCFNETTTGPHLSAMALHPFFKESTITSLREIRKKVCMIKMLGGDNSYRQIEYISRLEVIP